MRFRLLGLLGLLRLRKGDLNVLFNHILLNGLRLVEIKEILLSEEEEENGGESQQTGSNEEDGSPLHITHPLKSYTWSSV